MATDYKINVKAKDHTKGSFNKVNKSIDKTKQAMGKLAGAFAAAFAVTKLINFAQESLEVADAIGKTADSIGVATEFLQKYQFAAQQSGIETEQFNKALKFFSKGVGEATMGTGLAKRAFEEMGLSLKDSSGQTKKTEVLFKEFFVTLDSIQEPFKRNGLLAQVFGAKVGISMANLIKDGSASMDELAESATGIFTDDTIRSAERFNDTMNKLNRQIMQPLSTKMIEFAAATLGVLEHFGVIEFDTTGKSLDQLRQKYFSMTKDVMELRRSMEGATGDYLKMLQMQIIAAETKMQPVIKAIKKALTPDPDDATQALNKIETSINAYMENLGTVEERTAKVAVNSMKKFEDTLVSSLKNGKLEFKAFSDYVIEQLLRIAIQEAILAPLKSAFKGFFSFGADDPAPVEAPSLDGGGYTGLGSRTGGVDGKGGFPAILHPNETVVDHTKGQSIGGTSTVNFNISTVDAAGFDQLLASRKGMITSIINQAMNSRGKIGVV